MPPLNESLLIPERYNKLIEDELAYDRVQLAVEHDSLLASFTTKQRSVYDEIMDVAEANVGGVFFLYG